MYAYIKVPILPSHRHIFKLDFFFNANEIRDSQNSTSQLLQPLLFKTEFNYFSLQSDRLFSEPRSNWKIENHPT